MTPDIKAWFVNDRLGETSGFPEFVDRQSLGIPFPLRDDRPAEGPVPAIGFGHEDLGLPLDKVTPVYFPDSVTVEISDAIKVLHIFERNEAAEWYENLFGREPNDDYHIVYPTSTGRIMPNGLMRRILPGIEDFDHPDIEDI